MLGFSPISALPVSDSYKLQVTINIYSYVPTGRLTFSGSAAYSKSFVYIYSASNSSDFEKDGRQGRQRVNWRR